MAFFARISKGFLLAMAFLYGFAMLGLWYAQESFLFSRRHEASPVVADVGWRRETVTVLGLGEQAFLVGEHQEREGLPVVLFLHGNSTSANLAASRGALALAVRGFRVVVGEYPGYAGNPGVPSEAGLRANAEAMAAFARRTWPGRRLAVVGESIGSAPAVYLAVTGQADLLVLDSGFTSMGATVAHHVPWALGAGLLLRHPMDNLKALQTAQRLPPVLVVVSAFDQVVPVRLGEEITQAIPNARLLRSLRAGHGMVRADPVVADAVAAWLRNPNARGVVISDSLRLRG